MTFATFADEGNRSIDLHAHTTASDGQYTPTELVKHAAELGLTAIAITDHDTVEGVGEAMAAGLRYGVEVAPGIELSAQIDRGQCHLLGYLIDPTTPALVDRLHEVRTNRNNRNEKLIARLNELGIPITLEGVAEIAGGDILARPHFAQWLMRNGVVSSTQEAFDRYLADGAQAAVKKDKLTPEECIGMVHSAGGLVFLAHPNNLKRDPAGTEAEIVRLKGLGLDGIEARYSQHTPEETARYLEMASRLGLLTSGGSDFHGPRVKPYVFLGRVEGDAPAPDSLLAAIKQVGHRT
jgi:predicted metal-dependent phosphoesterase TrpH